MNCIKELSATEKHIAAAPVGKHSVRIKFNGLRNAELAGKGYDITLFLGRHLTFAPSPAEIRITPEMADTCTAELLILLRKHLLLKKS